MAARPSVLVTEQGEDTHSGGWIGRQAFVRLWLGDFEIPLRDGPRAADLTIAEIQYAAVRHLAASFVLLASGRGCET